MQLKIDLQTVFNEFVDGKVKMIYHSANTVWWTHDPKDLGVSENGLPLDCFGYPLFQTDKVQDFLNQKLIEGHDSYGQKENRVRNFMLSHAKNIRLATDKMPPYSFELVKGGVFYKWADENIKTLH